MIIGITGSKGAGKTTTFKLLSSLFPNTKEATLAGKIKKVCSNVFELPAKVFEDPILKEKAFSTPIFLSKEALEAILIAYGFPLGLDSYTRRHIGKILHTPRQVLQYIGTELLRDLDPLIHCKYLHENLPVSDLVVITDIRFTDERDFFEALYPEFKMVYVSNTRAEAIAATDTHASEANIHKLKVGAIELDNNGDLENLIRQIEKKILKPLKNGEY
jgi:energy-coupling factor transporter ATP-binding protein EcfA2